MPDKFREIVWERPANEKQKFFVVIEYIYGGSPSTTKKTERNVKATDPYDAALTGLYYYASGAFTNVFVYKDANSYFEHEKPLLFWSKPT